MSDFTDRIRDLASRISALGTVAVAPAWMVSISSSVTVCVSISMRFSLREGGVARVYPDPSPAVLPGLDAGGDPMGDGEPLFFATPAEWREWLGRAMPAQVQAIRREVGLEAAG